MDREREGLFATSRSGHDKGCLYVVVGEDERSLYLSDGKYKPLEKPKRKNKRHVQIINVRALDVIAHEAGAERGLRSNEQIKRAIKLFGQKTFPPT